MCAIECGEGRCTGLCAEAIDTKKGEGCGRGKVNKTRLVSLLLGPVWDILLPIYRFVDGVPLIFGRMLSGGWLKGIY